MAAAATDKLKKLARKWVGQIGSAGVSDAVVTTIPLSSTTNLPTDTAVVAVIDRVDSNGTKTTTLEETVIGVVSGSNLINCVRGSEGTAQAHSAGAVVEILVTAKGWNDIVDWGLVQHGQTGSHTSALITQFKATGATINTGTDDATIVTPKAIADSNVVITDKSQTLSSKTLTSPLLQGTVDGWINANESWTYASATTITVPSGATTKYAKGDKIKLTQTTVKYFYIVNVADTVLTVTGGSDYTVANAAITLNYYSHAQYPVGFPSTFNTGTITWDTTYIDNGTGGQQPTGSKSIFTINGSMVTHFIELGGSGVVKNGTNTYLKFTLPSTLPAKNTSVTGSYMAIGTVFYPAIVYTGVVCFDNSNTVVECVVSQGATIADNATIQSTTLSYSYFY